MGFHWGKTPIVSGAAKVSYTDPGCRAGFPVVGAAGMLRQVLLTAQCGATSSPSPKLRREPCQHLRSPHQPLGVDLKEPKADGVKALQQKRECLQWLA